MKSISIGSLVRVKSGSRGSKNLTTSDEVQSVVNVLGDLYSLSGSAQRWKASDLTVFSTPTPAKLLHELDLFETCTLASNSTLTRVPNGYVMTSTSGHQVLIPSNSI